MSTPPELPGHGHEHEHDAPPPPRGAATPGPEPAAGAAPEDPGAQALSEALRSSFGIVRVVLAALIVFFLCSGVFTVGSQERAILLQFGRPVVRDGSAVLGPGLHWAFPYPVDERVIIPVAQLQTATSTIGWYAVTPEEEEAGHIPDAGPSLSPITDGYLLTADGNIIHAREAVRYRITDPLKFFLGFTNAAVVMTNFINEALIHAAARYPVDDALRRDVAGFKEATVARINQLIAAHELGVTLDVADLQVAPPRRLNTEFQAALTAELDRSKVVSEAQSYANRVVNEARGDASARVNAGETDRDRLVQSVAAEAQKFTSLLPEYRKNPEFFRRRLQLETAQRIFTNAQDKFYLPARTDGGGRELRLQLNREPLAPVRPPTP